MLYKELIERLKNNTIKINFHGHSTIPYDDLKKQLIDVSDILSEHLIKLKEDSPLPITTCKCYTCGQTHNIVFSNNELHLRQILNKTIKKCQYADGMPPIVTEITINSNILYFINYIVSDNDIFQDCPKDKKYSEEFSLNFYNGAVNRSKHLASNNIGYGQVGNTAVEIFKHKKEEKILIAEHLKDSVTDWNFYYHKEEEKNNLIYGKNLLKEYDYLGEVMLNVWRWTCVDKSILEKYNPSINNDITYSKFITKSKYEDIVPCKVCPGKWRITHYDGTSQHKFDGFTIATLELLKD